MISITFDWDILVMCTHGDEQIVNKFLINRHDMIGKVINGTY